MEIPRSAARELISVAGSADCSGFGRHASLFLPSVVCFPDLHPHSGIASVSMPIDGSLNLRDSRDAPMTLESGGMEWICSGSGPWHGGPVTVSGHSARISDAGEFARRNSN
jgi:hypothetical protein